MNEPLSANTKAILLLTSPLILGRSARAETLTPMEYCSLRRLLHSNQKEPADLVEPGAEGLLDLCVRNINKPAVSRERLQRLLDRGLLLTQAVESWRQRAIWVVGHRDEAYPQRLGERLKDKAPAILYGCGDRTLLNTGGLAVVGSRHVNEDILMYANRIGNLAASAKRTIVSGGARGVDQAAMNGALESGGKSIGILAHGLKGASTNRAHRDPILNGQLVLISPYDPSSGFNVGHAMQRNKLIYSLADAALVVNTEKGKGGTWNGAIEQLEKLHPIPLYVRSAEPQSPGPEALQRKGASPWPNPDNAEELEAIFELHPSKTPYPQAQDMMEAVLETAETPPQSESPQAVKQSPDTIDTAELPADQLFQKVKSLIFQTVRTPKSRNEIRAELGVTQGQLDIWLKRLLNEGDLEENQKAGALFGSATKTPLVAPKARRGLAPVESEEWRDAELLRGESNPVREAILFLRSGIKWLKGTLLNVNLAYGDVKDQRCLSISML